MFTGENDGAARGATRVWGRVPLVALALLLASDAAAAQEPQPEPWQLIQPPQSSLVFARDGSLIGEIGREWRTSVPLGSLPPYLPNAFIAVEDRRFRQHNGVDLIGVAGAIRDNLLGDSRGASTITQQLVGNMHPDIIDRTERSLSRKLAEQAAAIEMEKHYSKDQILEAYLNQISFGHGWFGVEAAARHYFGKSASQVSLDEAALLAALPKGPALYDPITHPERARERRDLVLGLMRDQDFITEEEAREARGKPIVTAANAGMSAPAPYLVDMVRAQAAQAGIALMAGGYKVHTTVDPELQAAAVEALRAGLERVENQPGYQHLKYADRAAGQTDFLQGAVVAIDAPSGQVRALVGGRDHAIAPFNRAVDAMRQPGSAFKPIVYAAALRDSLTAGSLVADTAVSIVLPSGGVYTPANSDREFLGALTLREALVRSRNSVAVQLGAMMGMNQVAALARTLGIESRVDEVPASAIGASVLHPIELVSAYTAFANMGIAVEPVAVLRIEDSRGREVWSAPPRAPKLALDPRVAFITRDMMRDVAERGTGAGVRQFVPVRIPVAGKTGTTNDNADVWFVGMTPDIVAGVWLGFDQPRGIAAGAYGGTLAAPVWGDMIARWYGGRAAGAWVMPAGVIPAELDRRTGQVADEATPPDQRYTEFFVAGTEPLSLRPNALKLFRAGPIGGM